jgi:predicted dehydrogenase
VSARLPIGVVGVGALGRHHARHLAMLDEAELVGVYDTDEARAAEVAGELGVTAFGDFDALLARVQAVTIAVPTPAHAAVGLRALERGVPVLMEKPLAATVAEADALIAAAARGGVQLQVGHIERYNRALRAAEPYLDGPRYIESQRLAPFQPRGTDVAVVLDLMIHDLDLVLRLTGGAEATEVRASGLALLSSHLDIANARVEFTNGAVALATASRVSRERVRRLRLFQPNGYLSLDLASGAGEFMRVRPDWQPGTGTALTDVVERVVLEAPEADALQLELRSFVHAVRGEREVVVSGEEGRSALALALRVADAVRTSPLAVSTAG